MASFLASVGAIVVAAVILALGRELRRISKTVSDSAAAAASLTAAVANLSTSDAENRERIAALWARVFSDPSNLWSPH